MSLAENIVPVRESSIENSVPVLPIISNTVEPLPITSNGLLEPDTNKLPVITAVPEKGNGSTPVKPLPSPV